MPTVLVNNISGKIFLWCDHMKWKRNFGWYLQDREWAIPVGIDWQFCIVCGKPNPKEIGFD